MLSPLDFSATNKASRQRYPVWCCTICVGKLEVKSFLNHVKLRPGALFVRGNLAMPPVLPLYPSKNPIFIRCSIIEKCPLHVQGVFLKKFDPRSSIVMVISRHTINDLGHTYTLDRLKSIRSKNFFTAFASPFTQSYNATKFSSECLLSLSVVGVPPCAARTAAAAPAGIDDTARRTAPHRHCQLAQHRFSVLATNVRVTIVAPASRALRIPTSGGLVFQPHFIVICCLSHFRKKSKKFLVVGISIVYRIKKTAPLYVVWKYPNGTATEF